MYIDGYIGGTKFRKGRSIWFLDHVFVVYSEGIKELLKN